MGSASAELCVLFGLRKRGIVCFVLSPQAWNCNVLCFMRSPQAQSVLSPQAWNCNGLRKCRIVCFIWSPQARNSVLCIVTTSVEL